GRDPWFEVDLLVAGGLSSGADPAGGVAGESLPGLPFVLAGRSGAAAWASAPSRERLHDIHVERFNPNNPLQFRDGDTWEDAVRFRETIHVRGREALAEDVLVTRRGP